MSWSSVCRRRPLPTLPSSRCCACIVLLDDPSAIELTGPLLLNTDQRLPEAIFMQQQSSGASTQAAEQDLETSHECEKPDLPAARPRKIAAICTPYASGKTFVQ